MIDRILPGIAFLGIAIWSASYISGEPWPMVALHLAGVVSWTILAVTWWRDAWLSRR